MVIGSGFGGLFSTQKLKRADVDVTLIARTTHHLFQPLLYQVATGILSEGEIAPSTREVLHRQRNAKVLLGDVTEIDLAARTVTHTAVGRETVTPYDSLIVAAGAGQSWFGNDQFARHAPGMKSIDDALELRGRIFGSFELAELASTQAEIDRLMTFVVVGAGPTGVEMAGQISELARRTLKRDFRRIDPTKARVILLDAAPAVLGSFGEKLGDRAVKRLTDMGVEVRLGAKVVDVDSTGIEVEHADGGRERIESVCKVWAAGVSASPLGRQLADQTGAALDRAGRIEVQDDLTLPGHPEVHVVGDMMALKGLPGVAQVAIQGGRYAAEQIVRGLEGREPQGAVRVLRQGLDGDDLAVLGRGVGGQGAVQRVLRLDPLAGRPPRLHHRLQAPHHDAVALGRHLHRSGPLGAGGHRAAGVRQTGDLRPRLGLQPGAPAPREGPAAGAAGRRRPPTDASRID